MQRRVVFTLGLLVLMFALASYGWQGDGQIPQNIDYFGQEYQYAHQSIKASWTLRYTGFDLFGHRVFMSAEDTASPCPIYVESDGVYHRYDPEGGTFATKFEIGDCTYSPGATRGVVASVHGNDIEIHHVLEYSCCAVLGMRADIYGDTIYVYMINYGDVCRCVCNYEIAGTLSGVPSGEYHLRICGVMLHEPSPISSDYGIVWEQDITIA